MIRVTVRNLEEVTKKLRDLPQGTKKTAIPAFGEYLIGDTRHGLRHYPPRRQHGEENPYKWQSEKQRRAYFATDGFGGGIPYKRTDKLSQGWALNGLPYRPVITNPEPHAPYVMGDALQRGHKADGWRHFMTVISDNLKGAMKAAEDAVKRYLKTKGL